MPKNCRSILVIVIGSLVFVALGFGLFMVDRLSHMQTRLVEASLEISLEISAAHLHFHEAVQQQDRAKFNLSWTHLETADRYTRAILIGGRLKGEQVPVSSDSTSRRLAQAVHEDLVRLVSEISVLRDSRESNISSNPLIEDCDVQFDRPVKNVRALGVAIRAAVDKEIFLFRAVQIGLMALCPICAIWIAIWVRQSSRKQIACLLAIEHSRKILEEEIERREKTARDLRIKERLLLATLESTADAILVVNSEGRTVLVNNNFVRLWKIPDNLLAERDDETMLTFVLEQLEEPQKFLAKVRMLYQSTDEDSDTLHFRDGRVIFRFSQPLMEDGKINGRVWSFRDITHTAKLEQTLNELQAQGLHAL